MGESSASPRAESAPHRAEVGSEVKEEEEEVEEVRDISNGSGCVEEEFELKSLLDCRMGGGVGGGSWWWSWTSWN